MKFFYNYFEEDGWRMLAMVLSMGLTDAQIAKAVNHSPDTVKEWIESCEKSRDQTDNQ